MSTQERLLSVRRRAVIAGSLLAVAPIVAACSHDAPRHRSTARAPYLGAFAGYYSIAKSVRSVSASWVVPPILHGSGAGSASTWIGAQGPGATGRAPFIQVGVATDRSAHGIETFSAFWTDTARGFHPTTLFDVSPGDSVSASLRLRAGYWQVSIIDRGNGLRRRVVTVEEAHGHIDHAEWAQEDPARRHGYLPNDRAPYAATAPVRFSALRVNGRDVKPSALTSTWMTPLGGDGHELAPTALAGDAFTVAPRRLTAAAARYLEIVAPASRTYERLYAVASQWRRSTPRARYEAAGVADAAALQAADRRLAAGHWPTGVAALIAEHARVDRPILAFERRLSDIPPSRFPAWRTRWVGLLKARGVATRRLRAVLGAPGFVYKPR